MTEAVETHHTVFLLLAEHQTQGGIVSGIYKTEAGANVRAAVLVNIMLDDTESEAKPAPATPEAWRGPLEWLQDYHGAANCFVEINACPIEE